LLAHALASGSHRCDQNATPCIDFLVEPTATARLSAGRISATNTHGTGCTLSSAIAAGLAKGLDLAEAVREAKAYVTAAIAASHRLQVGHGQGPLHHFHSFWSLD
jgi:hydroxymethylpyrimidine/phosphomethylpyrimidine kinase